jgi:DNA recombination protein RmuC
MELIIAAILLAAGIAIGWLLGAVSRGSRQRAAGRAGDAFRDAIGAEAADALERVQQQLVSLEVGRNGADAALREQLRGVAETSRELRTETAQLVTALRAPQVRGRWGEMQLERVIEAAGMAEHVDYETQVSASGDERVQRPDLVVQLAGGKRVVVDAKVPITGYLDALEARDERSHAERMRAHARHLRGHIDTLAAKSYWQRFSPSPEFVVCFVPADAFLDAALREDSSLLEHAFTHDVVLATPSTLVALLRTIAYSWRQEALAENAAAIHDLGRELYRRISTMGSHVERLGRSLGTAVSAYNDAVGSLERRVVSTARRMSELGVVSPDEPLHAPEPLIDVAPRSPAIAEWVEPRLVSLPTQPRTQPGPESHRGEAVRRP